MKFITFEGIEGCGKSTQSKKLYEYFLNKSADVILTREPGGTKTSEKIREILITQENLEKETEILLNFAARKEHVEKLIKPSLAKNKIVISDRFFDSSYAYQGNAMGLDYNVIDEIKKLTIGDFAPDITFLIDVSVNAAFSRITNRSDNNRYETLGEKFHNKVRDGFLEMARQNERIKIIDGSKNEEEVFAQILTYLEK